MQAQQTEKDRQLNLLIQRVVERVEISIHGRYLTRIEYQSILGRIARLEQENRELKLKLKLGDDSTNFYGKPQAREIIYQTIDTIGGDAGLSIKEIEQITGLLASSVKSGLRILKNAGIVDSEFDNREYYVPCKRYFIVSKRLKNGK